MGTRFWLLSIKAIFAREYNARNAKMCRSFSILLHVNFKHEHNTHPKWDYISLSPLEFHASTYKLYAFIRNSILMTLSSRSPSMSCSHPIEMLSQNAGIKYDDGNVLSL